jgi:hypothetical protein
MTMGKRVAILQSNYIPWKGYFDLIASVDEFIFFDDVQFTKNDWRNRNKIKTPAGVRWLTVPVGQNLHREIREVELPSAVWQLKHWKTLASNYGRAPYFCEISDLLEPVYLGSTHTNLSALNIYVVKLICGYLNISTKFSSSWDYSSVGNKSHRLVDLCSLSGAATYVSGPSARAYLDENLFRDAGIEVGWFQYEGYPCYPQLWGAFVHEVSILDVLYNCGPAAADYMRFVR